MHNILKCNHKYPFLYLLAALVAGIISSEQGIPPGSSGMAFGVAGACLAAGMACTRMANQRRKGWTKDTHTGTSRTTQATKGRSRAWSKRESMAWRRWGAAADICLMATVMALGNGMARHTPGTHDPAQIIDVEARCEEVLTGGNHILSVQGERMYLSRFSTDTTFKAGDLLAFRARVLPFRDAGNPHEFNYAHYLKQQRVYHRLYPVTPVRQTGHAGDWRSFFHAWQAQLAEKAQRLTADTTCAALLQAVCLGYRQEMPGHLQELFVETGTVHLLAVSGLHVGMIYGMILFLINGFKRLLPLRWLPCIGPRLPLLALPLLWGYACLTGLAPSVVRAATILTLMAVGKAFLRDGNPANTLSAAAFLTLLAEPLTLYSLSFQLSYSAYAGILLLYPRFRELPLLFCPRLRELPKNLYKNGRTQGILLSSLRRFVYEPMCISLSAQLLTLPFCAYYFHTANVNGILANLPAIPLASGLLYSGTAALLLPETPASWAIPLSEWCCNALTGTLQWLSPRMVNIQGLYPTAASTGLWLAVLYATARYLASPGKRRYFYGCLSALLALLIYSLAAIRHFTTREEVVIFHYHGESAAVVNHRGFYFPLKNTDTLRERMQPYLRHNRLQPIAATAEKERQARKGTAQATGAANRAPRTTDKTLGVMSDGIRWQPPCLYYGRDTLLFPERGKPFTGKGNILIVTDNLPPWELFGKEDSPALPQQVVVDGSNRFGVAKAWETFCRERQIRFRNTAEEGAIIFPKQSSATQYLNHL